MFTRIIAVIIASLQMVACITCIKLGMDYINIGHGLTPYLSFPFAVFCAWFAFKILNECLFNHLDTTE
jgi:hypothetical protein